MDGAPKPRNAAHGHGAGDQGCGEDARRLPRLIGLDRAQANLRTTLAERHKFSQRKVDVLDFGTKSLCTKSLEKILDLFPKWQKKMVLSRDTDAEDMLAERQYTEPSILGTARAWWTIWSSYG